MVGQKSGHYRKRNKSQSKKKRGGKGDQGKKVGGKGAAGRGDHSCRAGIDAQP